MRTKIQRKEKEEEKEQEGKCKGTTKNVWCHRNVQVLPFRARLYQAISFRLWKEHLWSVMAEREGNDRTEQNRSGLGFIVPNSVEWGGVEWSRE